MNGVEGCPLCGIVMARMPSEEAARHNAEAMQNCPWTIMTGFSSDNYYALFAVPSDGGWRLDHIRNSPEVIGALEIAVVDVDNAFLPTGPSMPETKYDSPPCGANCEGCTLKEKYECKGCPVIRKHNANS